MDATIFSAQLLSVRLLLSYLSSKLSIAHSSLLFVLYFAFSATMRRYQSSAATSTAGTTTTTTSGASFSTTFLTLPKQKSSVKTNWLSDPSTYPLLVTLAGAVALCTGFGLSYLTRNPGTRAVFLSFCSAFVDWRGPVVDEKERSVPFESFSVVSNNIPSFSFLYDSFISPSSFPQKTFASVLTRRTRRSAIGKTIRRVREVAAALKEETKADFAIR